MNFLCRFKQRALECLFGRRRSRAVDRDTADAANDDTDDTDSPSSTNNPQRDSLDMGNLTSREAREVSHIIHEFITDELKYVAALDAVEDLFIRPLKTPAVAARLGVSDADDFSYRVFANWSSIRQLHRDVASRLMEACTVSTGPRRATTATAAAADGTDGDGGIEAALNHLDTTQTFRLKSGAHRLLVQIFLGFVPFLKIYSEFLDVQGGHTTYARHQRVSTSTRTGTHLHLFGVLFGCRRLKPALTWLLV